jgi:hypothetical protein
MTWVWEHSRAKGGARLVLLAIADSAEDDGSNAWPGISSLKRKCSMSERTVQGHIQTLAELGELRVELQAGGPPDLRKDRRPNRYTVLMSRGAKSAPRSFHGAQKPASRGAESRGHGVQTSAPNPSLSHPDPSSSAVDPPAPSCPDDDDQAAKLEAALRRLAENDLERRCREKPEERPPEGFRANRWRVTAVGARRERHEHQIAQLLAERPYLSVAGVAAMVEPATLRSSAGRADPREETVRAQQGLADRNARRARGDACPDCEDVGFVLTDAGAVPCRTCRAQRSA